MLKYPSKLPYVQFLLLALASLTIQEGFPQEATSNSDRRIAIDEAIRLTKDRGLAAAYDYLTDFDRKVGAQNALASRRMAVLVTRFVERLYTEEGTELGDEAIDSAIDFLRDLETQEGDPRYILSEARLLEIAGRLDEAYSAYVDFLKWNPKHRASLEALNRLDEHNLKFEQTVLEGELYKRRLEQERALGLRK